MFRPHDTGRGPFLQGAEPGPARMGELDGAVHLGTLALLHHAPALPDLHHDTGHQHDARLGGLHVRMHVRRRPLVPNHQRRAGPDVGLGGSWGPVRLVQPWHDEPGTRAVHPPRRHTFTCCNDVLPLPFVHSLLLRCIHRLHRRRR